MWPEIIVSALGGAGVTLAIVAWLSKQLINQQLDKEIERLKSELGEKAEVLKTGLSIYSHEQNVSASLS